MMPNDADFPRQSVQPTGDGGLDPALRRQIETSLHGAYAFNAATAKYGVVWVWVPKLIAIGLAIGAIYCSVTTVALLFTANEMKLLKYGAGQYDYFIHAYSEDWVLYLTAAVAMMLGWAFFSYIARAMAMSHNTATAMAAQFKHDQATQHRHPPDA